MKRFAGILLLLLLLALTVLGCAKQESVYTVVQNGMEFKVDTEHKTISDGVNTYQYQFSGDAHSYKITITYPNGATYQYARTGGMGYGSLDDEYAADAYAMGDMLAQVVQTDAPKHTNPGKMMGALVMLILGALEVFFPEKLWSLRYGWRYKNAEPSDAALIVGRICGGGLIVVGVILLLS